MGSILTCPFHQAYPFRHPIDSLLVRRYLGKGVKLLEELLPCILCEHNLWHFRNLETFFGHVRLLATNKDIKHPVLVLQSDSGKSISSRY